MGPLHSHVPPDTMMVYIPGLLRMKGDLEGLQSTQSIQTFGNLFLSSDLDSRSGIPIERCRSWGVYILKVTSRALGAILL